MMECEIETFHLFLVGGREWISNVSHVIEDLPIKKKLSQML